MIGWDLWISGRVEYREHLANGKQEIVEREIVKHRFCQIWKREQKIGVSGFVHKRSKHCQNFEHIRRSIAKTL